jgi:molybdopterin molybdotransferase
MKRVGEMITLEEAFQRVDAALEERRTAAETLPLHEAAGRILASDAVSRLDLPPFDKAAVDGFAVKEGDECAEYRLVETIAAGHPGCAELRPGTTVKVMTGAPLPKGTGKVVMLEHASEYAGLVRFTVGSPDVNICRRAEDVSVGQTVLGKGRRLTALEIANLAACGVGEVETAAPPAVFVVSTGDEIVDRADRLSPGKIIDSNGPLLAGLAREHGLLMKGRAWAPDEPGELEKVLAHALGEAEIVVLSGGVSVGEFDYVPEVVRRLGLSIKFDRVAVKPGKPTTFAAGQGRVLFGLPGNPVAVYLMFHLLVVRAAARLTGAPAPPRQFVARLARSFERRHTARTEFVPARITPQGDLERVEYHGSAHFVALMQADGFFMAPAGVARIAAGELVTFAALGLKGGAV